MTVLELLRNRRAVRNYTNEKIERKKIELLLEAATLAPNDRMREPWSFYIIQEEAKLRYEKLAMEFLEERFPTKPSLIKSSLDVVRNTPLIIIVTSDIASNDADSKDNEYAVCCAIHSMWLQAQELDLGFVWRTRGVGLVHDSRSFDFIGSPEGKKVIGTLFIGHPSQNALNQQKEKIRTSFEDKTIWMER
ncbi:nitroreductase [Alkalihalophilus pseudofirmus]|uniref:nitroreductase family protein n=1 Tax=Alkalihalophilus pseudofirmus TaxID=79885 RepID=UPI000950FB87|nr:nitroreductase [Alkalihalophilus pseudofirmus]